MQRLFALLFLSTWASPALAQVVFEDDFEAYDVANPALFTSQGAPTGTWTPSDAVADATRIFDTTNFAGTRLWISLVDGTGITSRGIELVSDTEYGFSVVLVSETFNGARQLNATFDLLVGSDPLTATSVIGGPREIVTRGDDWQVEDSKEDHVFTADFTTGTLSPGELLFVRITRIDVAAGSPAWFGVDDVVVRRREPVEVLETGVSTEVREGGTGDALEVYVRGSPASTVSVTATTDGQVLVDGAPETVLIFRPPVDPELPQLLEVTAVDDEDDEGLHAGRISFSTTSAAIEWNGYPVPDVDVVIQDDDWPVLHASTVFTGGEDGYPVYRIPGMTVAHDGSVLAFTEARPNGQDPGAAGLPIDLVLKRSQDNGRTWSELVVLEDDDAFDYSDPCPILVGIKDAADAAVFLLYTRWPDDAGLFDVPPGTGPESSNHFLRISRDSGRSWSEPVNITSQIKQSSWRGLVMGPGNGIQLRRQEPARNGRLVAPAHIHGTRNFVVYSDDGGTTWRSGTRAQPETGGPPGNENEVVELVDGDLLMNARQGGGTNRVLFRGPLGGEAWDETYGGGFPVTTVDGSMMRFSAEQDGGDRNRILFAAPLGDPPGSGAGRWNIGVRTSYDEGRTFINPVQLDDGFGAYSVLALLADGNVALLYESAPTTAQELVAFRVSDLEHGPHSRWLTHYEGFGNRIDPRQGGVGWSGFWTGDAAFDGSEDVPFDGFGFPQQAGFVHLSAGRSAERSLATPVELGGEGAAWISLLVRRDRAKTRPTEIGAGSTVELRDAMDVRISFGVDGDGRLAILAPGGPIATDTSVVKPGRAYLLLAKLTTERLFLTAFEAGDPLPSEEEEIVWILEGGAATSNGGFVDGFALRSGKRAGWSFDEIRIAATPPGVGDGLGAVVRGTD